MEKDIASLCGICFQEGDVDLFSGSVVSKDILNNIYECLQVRILYEKHKPCRICNDCLGKLKIVESFRQQCLTIDERFRKYEENYKFKEEESSVDNSLHIYENVPERGCLESDDASTLNRNKSSEINTGLIRFKEEESSVDNSLHIYENKPQRDCLESSNACPLNKKKLSEINTEILKINDRNSTFKCNLCNKVLKTNTSLLKHYVSMHEKRKHVGKVSGFGAARRYHCTTCSYSTPHSQTLVNHIRRHNGEKPYSCECGKSFTQSSSLAAHRKTHSNTTYFTCSFCGKQFKHAFSMKKHLRVHENGCFSCNICFKSLKSKESLQSHMHRHYNIYNYNCEDCGNTFVTSSELLNHSKKHALEKKIECHLCGYKTYAKKNLIIHIKRHTGNRSFKCNLCQVAFYTQSNLLRHQRVHTRDKPFSCPTCSQKFTYSPSLNRHMRTVHGVDYKWADFKCKDAKIVKLTKSDTDLRI